MHVEARRIRSIRPPSPDHHDLPTVTDPVPMQIPPMDAFRRVVTLLWREGVALRSQ
jgi:hypothetical protein